MKNLPDKIYLNLNMTPQEVDETEDQDFDKATKTWEITWSEERLSEHDPEYVRKDAFIEKTTKWLNDNIWAYIEIMHPTIDSYTRINRERLIWDFKKVMRR